jgi:DNA-3-methyladenine glycosylase I
MRKVYQAILESLRKVIDISEGLDYYRKLDTSDWTDNDFFEVLSRTVFSGIRNNIIESRWSAISNAFSNFDFQKVAKYGKSDLNKLLNNPEIIRHKPRLKATISNAKKMVEIVKQYGSFKNYLNSFPSIDSLVEKLQGYHGGFKGIGETNVYEFVKEIGLPFLKPNRNVKRVFLRLGLINKKASQEEIIKVGIQMAKENNERPCAVDWVIWNFGSYICKLKPLCNLCLVIECPYRRANP